MTDYVNLDRRFQDTRLSGDSEAAALASYASSLLPPNEGISWADVLQHRLVVVLGEPGSGKTAELRAQASCGDASQERRFFVRLDDLVQGIPGAALPADYSKNFDSWRRSGGDATFFLDSVDESKYRNNDDFIRALERLSSVLGYALPRAKFVISSRISEWRPQADKDAVLRVFGLFSKSGADESIKILRIEPLDRSRVERYAREKGGIENPQDFIQALDRQHAWPFARRPVDVVPLFNYWKVHQRLGTLTELVEYGLTASLAETENREKSDLLSPEKAREGAESLAAAAIFCKQFKIAVPDRDFLADTGAIDPTVCLPDDWQPGMRRALLARAVFDSATYGHIRFHHRNVLDYLAANWLARLMNADCTLDVLEDLLFQVNGERKTLRPSLAPLAAWLANGDEPWRVRLRDWIKQAAPWVFFQHGDGAGLPLDYRQELLRAIVQHYHGRSRVMLDWSAEALSRLASPELAADINIIIRDTSVSEDLRADMLSLARHGGLRGCIPVAIEIVGNESTSDSLKSYATALVRDIGSTEDRRNLAIVSDGLSNFFSTVLASGLCQALFPSAVDAKGIAALLGKTADVDRHGIDLPYYLREHLESHLTADLAFDMLVEMLSLLNTPPLQKEGGLSERFAWVVNLLPVCLVKLSTKSELDAPQLDAAAQAFMVLEKANRYSLLDNAFSRQSVNTAEVRSLLDRHPQLRRQVFWDRVRVSRDHHGHYPVWYHPLECGELEVGLLSIDVDWLMSDVADEMLPSDERSFVARTILDMPGTGLDILKRARSLLRRSADSVVVRAEVWRGLRTTLAKPFMAIWYRHVRNKLADRYWWRRRYWDFQRRYDHLREQWTLHRHCQWLRSGQRWDWLANLASEAQPSSTQRSPGSWEPLREKRGKRITEAVRVGCETFWPRYTVPLPHEKPIRNQTDVRVTVGLAGLQSLWHRGALNFSLLSDDDVRAATRYGCEELNGFPEWFFALGKERPLPWCEVILDAIRGEWDTPADQEHANDVLAKLVWQGKPYWAVFDSYVFGLIQKSDPAHPRILEYALTILLGGSLGLSRLAELAATRVEEYKSDSRQFVLWLTVWIQIAAQNALNYLEEAVSAMAADDGDDLVLRLCAAMKQDRLDPNISVPRPDYVRPQVLGRFMRFTYRHVRPDEDINRARTGAYSPGIRDHAQRFRSTLFELLDWSDDVEADSVLRSLLDAPEMHSSREWILHLLDKRIERAADFAPWQQIDVRAFAKEHEIAPHSSYDLFRIACRRLGDIKREVESAENSLRGAVRHGDEEKDLQRWLQKQLFDRAHSRYTIPKEAEDDFMNRPDLRLEHPGIKSVMIEMKLADMPHWTLPKLMDGLESQLVGKYLLAHNANYGIYLLGNTGRRAKGWEDSNTGTILSFDQVVEEVREKAQAIMANRKEILGLEVISVDFVSPKDT